MSTKKWGHRSGSDELGYTPDTMSKEELVPEDVERLREIVQPQGLRGIDDAKFNAAADAVRNFCDAAGSTIDEIADNGLVVTWSIFGLKITNTIQIAKDTPT